MGYPNHGPHHHLGLTPIEGLPHNRLLPILGSTLYQAYSNLGPYQLLGLTLQVDSPYQASPNSCPQCTRLPLILG